MTVNPEDNLAKLGITLPDPYVPRASYAGYTYAMGLLSVSGMMSQRLDGEFVIGKCGRELSVEDGAEAARLCGIVILSQVKQALGRLDRVKKVLKITCLVNSTADFTQQPTVANGCSDLLVNVFGRDVGCHARCAVGLAQLPFGVAVEIDALIEVDGAPPTL